MLIRIINRRFTSACSSALTKRKRFYKDVNVIEEGQGTKVYKVALDGRMLKTYSGRVVEVESEPLALAIAEEWASQQEHIHLSNMRLTGLAFTALDNPLRMNKFAQSGVKRSEVVLRLHCVTQGSNERDSITSRILEYLHGDTVLYWNNESERLERYQKQYWQPVIDHANRGLGTSFKPSRNLLDSDVISSRDSRIVEKWLMSYNLWSLIGMQYAVESLKSVLLPYSVFTFKLGAKEAVHCATLEQKAQTETWGSVEWGHEVEQEDLTSRLAAAALFVYFTSNNITKISHYS